MALPEIFIQHEVTVEVYDGVDGNNRPVYQAEFPLPCFVEDARRRVRDANGDEVISESTVYADPGPVIPAKSRVTLPSGRLSKVILVKDHDAGDLDQLPEHIEIVCE